MSNQIHLEKTGDQNVDRVLSSLVLQLRKFEPRTMGGISVEELKSVVNTFYYQTFEDPITPGWTYRHSGTPAFSYPTNGKAGGKAFRIDGAQAWLENPTNIPIDSDRLYRMRTRFRVVQKPSTTGYCSFGVKMVASDGTTTVDYDGGTDETKWPRYIANNVNINALTLNQWYTYEGYVQGEGAAVAGPSTDASAPRLWETGAAYFRIVMDIMGNSGGSDGIVEVDYIAVQTLTETPEVDDLLEFAGGRSVTTIAGTVTASGNIGTNFVQSGSIAAGAVIQGKLGVDAVVANNIEAGAVVAGKIATNAVTADTINAGAVTTQKLFAEAVTTEKVAALAITSDLVAANAIIAGKIAADAVTATEINVANLAAISATMGTLTAGQISSGKITISADDETIIFGDATAPMTGKGIWMGKDGTAYEFRVGDPSGYYIHFDGTNLDIETRNMVLDTEFRCYTSFSGQGYVHFQDWNNNGFKIKQSTTVLNHTWTDAGDVTFLQLNGGDDTVRSKVHFVAENTLEHDGTTAGFFGATPVTQRTDPGSPTFGTVGATYSQTEINDIITLIEAEFDKYRTRLSALGLFA